METCWIKTPIHGAFKEFYTVLQLQIPKHNFNVVRTLIWSLPIILIENEIMMQHSRHSVCSLAIFKERLFSACYEKTPVTYTSSKFFLESSILTEWSRNPSSNWDADWKGRNKMEEVNAFHLVSVQPLPFRIVEAWKNEKNMNQTTIILQLLAKTSCKVAFLISF